MNRVVDHIQAHLAEPLDLERLSAVACFSPFHFHRLFSAWMGETLQSFVHRLRLERAAQLLVFHRLTTISDIALECGFSSASVFARSFKAAYGVSAGEWRNRKICQTNSKPCEAETAAFLGFSKLPGPAARQLENHMTHTLFDVQVRRLAPLTIAYLRYIGPYKGDTELFRRLFAKLFAWAGPGGLMPPGFRYLSLFQDNPKTLLQNSAEIALTFLTGL